MITLIPLAGRSARFRMAGYEKPKPLLPVPGYSSLLARVLDALAPESLITVAMREDMRALAAEIRTAQLARGFRWRAVWLDARTASPLETVLKAKKWLKSPDELVVSYCDCFLLRDGLARFLEHLRSDARRQAAIVGVASDDPRLTPMPVSALRAGGVFWFRHAHEFAARARGLPVADSVGVPDVVYRFPLWTAWDGTEHYVDVGTPEDYRRYLVTVAMRAQKVTTLE